MTGTGGHDDLGRTIARTLTAKADQLVVDGAPSSPIDVEPDVPVATVIHLTPPRPSRRRILVVLAAAAVAIGAGAALARSLGDDAGTGTLPAPPPGPVEVGASGSPATGRPR